MQDEEFQWPRCLFGRADEASGEDLEGRRSVMHIASGWSDGDKEEVGYVGLDRWRRLVQALESGRSWYGDPAMLLFEVRGY